jgi:hypothetical protein
VKCFFLKKLQYLQILLQNIERQWSVRKYVLCLLRLVYVVGGTTWSVFERRVDWEAKIVGIVETKIYKLQIQRLVLNKIQNTELELKQVLDLTVCEPRAERSARGTGLTYS